MYTLNSVMSKCKENNIQLFKVVISPETINGSIRFNNIDDFISYMHLSNVKHAFLYDVYDDVDDYLITEEVIEENILSYARDEIVNCISQEIINYNEKVKQLQLDSPSMIFVLCNVYGQMFSVCLENIVMLDDEEVMDPVNVLLDIVESNMDKINKNKEKLQQKLEKQQELLKEYILKDEDFYKSTNKSLRLIYAQKLYKDKMGKNLKELKDYWSTPYDLPSQGLKNFIEYLWKEFGKKK